MRGRGGKRVRERSRPLQLQREEAGAPHITPLLSPHAARMAGIGAGLPLASLMLALLALLALARAADPASAVGPARHCKKELE